MEPNNVKSFICYDLETKQILAFIRNDYTTIESADEVFQHFTNYGIVETELDVPNNFTDYKVQLDDENKFIGLELIENNEKEIDDHKEVKAENVSEE